MEILSPAFQIEAVPGSSEAQEAALENVNDAIAILKSQPSFQALERTLDWLEPRCAKADDFNIKAFQIGQINLQLLTKIIPAYWRILSDSRDLSHVKVRGSLIKCLNTIMGILTIMNWLSRWTTDRQSKNESEVSGNLEDMVDLLSLLQTMLNGTEVVLHLWDSLQSATSCPVKRTVQWKEAVSLLAGSKILSLAAQIEDAIRDSSSHVVERSWITNGVEYSTWLGHNTDYMMTELATDDKDGWNSAIEIFGKALNLGYRGKCKSSSHRGLLILARRLY